MTIPVPDPKNVKTEVFSGDVGKIAHNIAWLFMDKVVRMGAGVFVVILLARYLGPEQFGLFNYTLALVALFAAFSGLGLNAIMTRDLITRPDRGRILGTAFGLRVLSSVMSYIALVISIYILRGDEFVAKMLALIMGVSLLFNSSEIVKFWFESQIRSKYTVIVENSAFIFFATIKLILIYLKASLVFFACAVVAEALFVCGGLFLVYFLKNEGACKWEFKLSEAKYLLAESWPLIISSVAWVIYIKVDQIMIGQMLGDVQVGLYSAASRLSEIANFLPTIIVFSVVPAVLKLKKSDRKEYERRFQQLYYFVVTGMVFIAIMVTCFSNFIIYTLYGERYLEASSVLSIHFWIVVCTTLAVVSGRYLVNDGLQKFTMKRHVVGVVLNIPMNYYMIPIYGIEGSAFASLISLFLANYIFDAFDKRTRVVFLQKSKAILFFWVYEFFMMHRKKAK